DLGPRHEHTGDPWVAEIAYRRRELLAEPLGDPRRPLHAAAHNTSSSSSSRPRACSIPPSTPPPASPKGRISVARSQSTASGRTLAILATSSRSLSHTDASFETQATPNVARRGSSSDPTSAMETLRRPCTRSFSDRTTLLLSLSVRAPTIS